MHSSLQLGLASEHGHHVVHVLFRLRAETVGAGAETPPGATPSVRAVQVAIRPAPIVTRTVVRHGYRKREIPDGILLEVGELRAGEPKLLIAEFAVPGAAAAQGAVRVAELLVTGELRGARGLERRELRVPIDLVEGAPRCGEVQVRSSVAPARAKCPCD